LAVGKLAGYVVEAVSAKAVGVDVFAKIMGFAFGIRVDVSLSGSCQSH